MNFDDETIQWFLSELKEIPEKYYVSWGRERTKAIHIDKLKEILKIPKDSWTSKDKKLVSKLCADVSYVKGQSCTYIEKKPFVWFTFIGAFRNTRKPNQIGSDFFEDKYSGKGKGVVYLLGCGDYYKIGYSKNIQSRLSSIRTSNPFQVDLLATYECTDGRYSDLEKLLHEKFKDSKHKLEWFNKDFSVDDFLQACKDLS
jgi:hypothetical protein